MNIDTVYTLSPQPANTAPYVEPYLGMGGWQAADTLQVLECLPSVLTGSMGQRFRQMNYTVAFQIYGFAGRVMDVRIGKKMP